VTGQVRAAAVSLVNPVAGVILSCPDELIAGLAPEAARA
jgi:hypothetical protein